MHQSANTVTIDYDGMIAMRTFEVQLRYFEFRIEHLCSKCKDTAPSVPRWKQNRIIIIQKCPNTIMCSFKSTHTTQIFLESIMQCRKILIGLFVYFFPTSWALTPIYRIKLYTEHHMHNCNFLHPIGCHMVHHPHQMLHVFFFFFGLSDSFLFFSLYSMFTWIVECF